MRSGLSALPLYHRVTGQPVIVVGESEAADAKRRLVERAGGTCVAESDAAARLAFVALAEPEDVAARLKARGVLVNVVDRPELCDFTTPSLLERGPLVVAVGSGGTSAGLSKALRLRLERMIPASAGRLAHVFAGARAGLRARWPDPAARRHALDAALGEGGSLDLLAENAADGFDAWLDGSETSKPAAASFVFAGDDPDDLTLRQARLLGGADLIAYEPGVPGSVLARARADAVLLELGSGASPPDRRGSVVIIRRS